MGMSIIRRLMVVAVMLGALVGAGCYVEPAEGEVMVGNYGYEPMYYDGYMVYYDPAGRPYYYMNGAVVWIAPSSPYYARYVAHYRAYGPAYTRWYGAYGTRYRGYRVQGGYYGGHHGYRRAPAPVRRHR